MLASAEATLRVAVERFIASQTWEQDPAPELEAALAAFEDAFVLENRRLRLRDRSEHNPGTTWTERHSRMGGRPRSPWMHFTVHPDTDGERHLRGVVINPLNEVTATVRVTHLTAEGTPAAVEEFEVPWRDLECEDDRCGRCGSPPPFCKK